MTFCSIMSDTSTQYGLHFLKAVLYFGIAMGRRSQNTHLPTHTHGHTHLWHSQRPPHSPSFLSWRVLMFIVTRRKLAGGCSCVPAHKAQPFIKIFNIMLCTLQPCCEAQHLVVSPSFPRGVTVKCFPPAHCRGMRLHSSCQKREMYG